MHYLMAEWDPSHYIMIMFTTNITASTTYLRGYKSEVSNPSCTEIEICKGYVKNK